MTEWKDISDFEYEISDYGDIRSKKFKRILTPSVDKLYITKYSNGFMIRINRHDFKHKSWHKTLEDAIEHRKLVVEGAMVKMPNKIF